LKKQSEAEQVSKSFIDLKQQREVEFKIECFGQKQVYVYHLCLLDSRNAAENSTRINTMQQIQDMAIGCELILAQNQGRVKLQVHDADNSAHADDCCIHAEPSGKPIRQFYFFNPDKKR